MTKREIASLACKVLGIYAVVRAVEQAGGIVFALRNLTEVSPAHVGLTPLWLIAAVGPFVLLLFLGVLLWLLADGLGRRMVSPDQALPGPWQVSAPDVQAIAFSVVGLFVLADAIPRATYLISNLAYRTGHPAINNWLRVQATVGIAALVVQLAIGLVLFFGAQRVVALLRSIRRAGLYKPPDPGA